MTYDPHKSKHVATVKEVKAATNSLLEELAAHRQAPEPESKIPDFSTWTLQDESVEIAFDSIILRLAIGYELVVRTVNGFSAYDTEILRPFLEGSVDADALIKRYSLPVPYDGSMVFIINATASLVAALFADREGQPNKAWKHIANATYQLGMLQMTFMVGPMVKELHRINGMNGRLMQDAKKEPLIQFAREQAIAGNFPSQRAAALAIVDVLTDKAKELFKVTNFDFWATTPNVTIYGWLSGIDFQN